MQRRSVSDVSAHLLVCRTEPRGPAHAPEPAHGSIAPFTTPMILFDHIVFVLTATVDDLRPQDLPDGLRVGVGAYRW